MNFLFFRNHFLNGIVQPKINIFWKFTHRQAIQDEDESIS